MSVKSVRVLAVVAVCAFAVTGCGSWSTTAFGPKDSSPGAAAAPVAQATPPVAPEPETTGSIAAAPPLPAPAGEAAEAAPRSALDPDSDLNLGKRHFRANDFGLAERYFRRAIEKGSQDANRDAEAWIGLAASYDRLRRFELADRAYAHALRTLGPTPELLNNIGYSYLIRGDYRRAREKLLAARDKDPDNPYIRNNLALLEKSERAKTAH